MAAGEDTGYGDEDADLGNGDMDQDGQQPEGELDYEQQKGQEEDEDEEGVDPALKKTQLSKEQKLAFTQGLGDWENKFSELVEKKN